jgi:hypothetical protein
MRNLATKTKFLCAQPERARRFGIRRFDGFAASDLGDFKDKLKRLLAIEWCSRRKEIRAWSNQWSIEATEKTLVTTVQQCVEQSGGK